MPVTQCFQQLVTQTRTKKILLALLPELSKAMTRTRTRTLRKKRLLLRTRIKTSRKKELLLRTRTRTSIKKGLLLRSLPELSNDEEDLQPKRLKRIKTLLS